jgi:hypothetical protein
MICEMPIKPDNKYFEISNNYLSRNDDTRNSSGIFKKETKASGEEIILLEDLEEISKDEKKQFQNKHKTS